MGVNVGTLYKIFRLFGWRRDRIEWGVVGGGILALGSVGWMWMKGGYFRW
jgi:hypothetical protein